MIEMNIGCGLSGMRGFGQAGSVMEAIPLVLGRQSERLAGCCRFPVAKGFCFMVIHFYRPIPGHGNFLGHQP